MNRYLTLLCALALCAGAFGQAKKPKLMVMPSDAWCAAHGFTRLYGQDDETTSVADYARAVQTSQELNAVVGKIGAIMADRGFPLQDLAQTLRNISATSAEDQLITSRTSGAAIRETPLDQLRRTAKADILLEVDWTVNQTGPKRSITYTLRGLDAYTGKQVAGAAGTGAASFSAETAVLLDEAVQDRMDAFVAGLQAHFDDLLTNGREVVLDLRVFDNASVDFETEYDGAELTERLDEWMHEHCVNHRFSKSDATETHILYDQVRIPIYRANGMAQDADGFARELARHLRKPPFALPCKVVNRGLGRSLIVIGEK